MDNIKLTPIEIYQFNLLKVYHNIKHFISTAIGGKSLGAFKGLNIGLGSDDNLTTVLENRQILANSLGIPLQWFVFPHQTHSNNVFIVEPIHKGKGVFSVNDAIYNTDALITHNKNICIGIQVADCVPLLAYDIKNQIIAAIHAGWRGLAQNIIGNTIETMFKKYSTKPHDVVVGIGPSIGPCCYEVGSELVEQFPYHLQSEIFLYKNKKLILDMWKTAYNQLTNYGINPKQIEQSQICTKCNSHIFYSSRAGKGITGRFMAGIMLQ